MAGSSFLRCFIFLFVCNLASLHSQTLSPRSENLGKNVSQLTYSGKADSAQSQILRFLEAKDLTPTENFHGNYLFADVIKSSSRSELAIPLFQKTLPMLAEVPDSSALVSMVYGNIAECYFNLMIYDSAGIYAKKSIDANRDSSLRSGGHAINYMIIGYGDFIGHRYESALAQYDLAMQSYIAKGEYCELPLCLMKIARVNNAMGLQMRAKENIDRAIVLSDSCGIEQYTLLAKRTLYKIFRENRNYEAALLELEEINDLVAKIENKKLEQSLAEMKITYEAQIVQQENDQLKDLNHKNEEILSQQKKALWILVGASLLLGALAVALIIISNKRKKAERNVSLLNSKLELQVLERTQHLFEANRSIRENTDMLIFQNKQLVDFCNVISHNLRSPMRNVSVMIDFIEKTPSEDKKKEFLDKLKPVIGSMNQTFDELLESLRVRQELDIKSDQINLDDALIRTKQDLSLEIQESGATINADFSAAPIVLYPQKYLSSILHNLVGNSLKYRAPGKQPVVTIRTEKKEDRVILSVCDNGLGIDLEKFGENIFKIGKVFHQHPNAKGFGLFITKTQVEAMKGAIRVESTPGKGSCFYVEFVGQQ